MLIRFIWSVFLLTFYLFVCVCASFSFGFECAMWDLVVLIPDHCLSIYFVHRIQ